MFEDLPEWRLEYDREVMKHLASFPQPQFCVMAGYMLVIGRNFAPSSISSTCTPRLQTAPPVPGSRSFGNLSISAGDSGVMTHLVTSELDKGPVVSYCRYPIRGPAFDALWDKIDGKTSAEIKTLDGEANPLFKEIRRHGAARELPLIGNTVKAFSRGMLAIKNGVTVNCGGHPVKGFDLSAELDAQVQNFRRRDLPSPSARQGRMPFSPSYFASQCQSGRSSLNPLYSDDVSAFKQWLQHRQHIALNPSCERVIFPG